MIVPNTSPVKSVSDFISYAKANRGRISYASAGHGTSPHLCGELFKRMSGIEMTHVPYRTGAQQDLVARARRCHVCRRPVRPAASRSRARACRDDGQPGRGSTGAADDRGIRPGGLRRRPMVGTVSARQDGVCHGRKTSCRYDAVLAEPEIQKRMQDLGSIPVGSTPEELARHLQAEMAKWGPAIRDANIRLDG